MRKLQQEGKLHGAPKELMQPFPKEMLFDTHNDPHKIKNLSDSIEKEHREVLIRMQVALDTWMSEMNDRAVPGRSLLVWLHHLLKKRNGCWFGTPDWVQP